MAQATYVFGQTVKLLKPSEARRLIRRLPGTSLGGSAVRVREVTAAPGGGAEAVATVLTAFRLVKPDDAAQGQRGGAWRVVEVRVGDRQWEDVELIARAAGASGRPALLYDVEALAAESAARQLETKNEAGRAGGEKEEAKRDGGARQPAAELRRGAVTAKIFSALLSSATLEAEVETGFRFAREGGGWRVTEVRIGGGEWQAIERLLARADEEKSLRARAEMREVSAALEAFRRERGFYVVSGEYVTLVDHLSPKYLARVVRVDPWHRPYRYAGARDSYALASDGPDGKPATPDDVTLSGPALASP